MKNIYITTGILIAIILGLFLVYNAGKRNGENLEKNNQIEEKIKPLIIKEKLTQKQVDSILAVNKVIQKEKDGFKTVEKEIIIKVDKIKLEKPKDSVCNDLFSKATNKISLLNDRLSIKDSIEKKSDNIINNQNKMLSKKDSIISYKDEQIVLMKNKKVVKKRFGVGANLGYGLSVNQNKIDFKPYVGLGITYTFFNF